MQRRVTTQTVSWFLDLARWEQLDLDPDYQRKSVWSQRYKEYFIDTVLRNYPSPTIFLGRRLAGEATIYEVIDGKQRLSTILEFHREEFATSADHSDPSWAEAYFSDLPPELKQVFRDYCISVEEVWDAETRQLNDAFDRLNRNVARLNAQELRNARYGGEFIKLMEQLASGDFWREIGVASEARVRRMGDVEYLSELFILTMRGIQDQKSTLDTYYADYDEGVPERDLHRRRFEKVKRQLEALDIYRFPSRYRNLADFYSLWAAVMDWQDEHDGDLDVDRTAERLLAFADEVNGTPDRETEAGKYLIAARQGSNKAANRELRKRILSCLLVPA